MRVSTTTLCFLLAACGSTSGGWTHTQQGIPDPETPASSPAQIRLADEVSRVDFECSSGAQEFCDGVDNDCNGRIDDDCGWQSGSLQITLAWTSGVDMDLVVTNDANDAAGTADKSGRGACEEAEHGQIENTFFDSVAPGTYAVRVRRSDACEQEGPTTVSVSVAHAGRTIGSYNRTLAEDAEEAEIFRVTVP